MRTEKDSLGDVQVPDNAFYGAQTQRAIDNFSISQQTMPKEFIRVLVMLKACAAKANSNLCCISQDKGRAIQQACETVLAEPNMMRHFPVDLYQTGSGTSSNMNANEVIAHVASLEGDIALHANDDVNYGQSSNDVIPSVIHISNALMLQNQLIPALTHLQETILHKSVSLRDVCKMGRTHLMDAMPVTLEQSLKSWAGQLRHHQRQLEAIAPSLHLLPLGGTAVGTGVNAHPDFARECCGILSAKTGITFTATGNPFSSMSGMDVPVGLSANLRGLAIALMKIANDLRWMNSGPLSGLGEIALPALQPGSSIMPGKVNPVIPESVAMVCAQVIGYDSAIVVAGQSGNFELNVMLPLIGSNLLCSQSLLAKAMLHLADKAIKDFTVNEDKLNSELAQNPVLVTALNPIIGYTKAAEIAKKAYSENREVLDVAKEMTDLSESELKKHLDPVLLTKNQ
ncbi:class II fumarate hydratase [Aestuariibacter sp. AA17]|uniref:Class II fumarate hydratase n=1 Tax=Fluctibacter corallii TaxID=2984329 RepID=A0ABT3A6J7_9ALTE|nr:class II fumarate hydratase [Aestuariibacter sp. AA17]MCV2884310.1 class II fumarate hydratase [Aestuariibacter sp. AA17]